MLFIHLSLYSFEEIIIFGPSNLTHSFCKSFTSCFAFSTKVFQNSLILVRITVFSYFL